MGVAERKAKEKEELKTLILRAAQKLFVDKGIEQTTIRSIADAIDYSVGTVYVYFKDKNAILYALHAQGFQELGRQFAVLANVVNPMERLRAMGLVYIRFALANQEMYELMFSVKAPINYLCDTETDWDEGAAAFSTLRDTVSACLGAGYFAGHSPEPLTYLIWSTVHGLCSLYISQRAGSVNLTDPNAIVERGFAEFLKMLDKF